MNGHHFLELPFRVTFQEVIANKEAVLNGLSAIQHFFQHNIWLPLGDEIEYLFTRGVLGATEGLCDWWYVASDWPEFEPEVPEEIDLWYMSFFFFFFFLIGFFFFFQLLFLFLLF
jgi:hypothetical protein